MVGPESFSVEHPGFKEILDYKGYSCWLLDFNFEVKPLKMSLRVRIGPNIEVVDVILKDDVLKIAALKIGIKGDVGVEGLGLPL